MDVVGEEEESFALLLFIVLILYDNISKENLKRMSIVTLDNR